MIKYFFSKQFLRFLVVGGIAALLHWLSRILLSNWLTFSWAVTSSYAVGMLVAFMLNSFFVFPKSEKPRHKQARDFIIINLSLFPLVWGASIAINNVLQALNILSNTQAIAHGIAVALPMFATFLIYKFFAFKESQFGCT